MENKEHKENIEIRELLLKYKISYNELLPYLTNFSHSSRISEELSKPLSKERQREYIFAVQQIKEKRKEFYSS